MPENKRTSQQTWLNWYARDEEYICSHFFFFITTSNEYHISPITRYYCFSICKIIIELSCRSEPSSKEEKEEKKNWQYTSNKNPSSNLTLWLHSTFVFFPVIRSNRQLLVFALVMWLANKHIEPTESHLTPSACDDRFKLDFHCVPWITCFFALGNTMTIPFDGQQAKKKHSFFPSRIFSLSSSTTE